MRVAVLFLFAALAAAVVRAAGADPDAAAVAPLPEPYASASLRRGQILFLQCVACHDLEPSGVPKVGPSLAGLAGRKAGSLAGFQYSAALGASGITWTPELLDRWLAEPAAMVPGTTMVIAPVARAEDRAAIVRYLFDPAPRP